MAAGNPNPSFFLTAKTAVLRLWRRFALWIRPEYESPLRLAMAVPEHGEPLALALFQSLGVRFEPGHEIAWHFNGTVFDAIVDGIQKAQSSVHVVIYIWEEGAACERVVSALIERAKAGVSCRLVVDAFGSSDFEDTLQPRLEAAGCEVLVFRPLTGPDRLARNHRKIVVLDGKQAIVGGFGIQDNWLGDGVHDKSWRDTGASFSGPTVANAQQAFAENWQEAGGALLPPEAFPALGPVGGASAVFVSSTGAVVTRAERLLQLLIAAARKRIWIANAYFVPSRGIFDLIRNQASAGLDVRVLAPGKHSDSKTAFGVQHLEYGSMIECGVRVWEYLPSMMHAKTMVIDDDLVVVGSINLDPLSLGTLEEGALVAQHPDLARELAEAFERDCSRSRELSAE